MRPTTFLLAAGTAIAASAAPARPQATTTGRPDSLTTTLSGSVRDSLGLPITGASIMLAPAGIILRSDSGGAFLSRVVPVGRVNLSVRRLGFSPADTTTLVHVGVDNVVDIVLQRVPQALPEVVVEADRQCRRYSLEGILCRRETGRGLFIGYEDVLAKKPVYLGDLLRDTPGFRVDVTPRGRTAKSVVGWRCIKTLVDGDELKRTNPTPRPQDVFAVEVFQPRDIPPEYRHWYWREKYPCTLVVFWSKRVLRRGLPP